MIWLIGCRGMLGTEVARQLDERKIDFVGTDREVDFTDEKSTAEFVEGKKIDFIINCAAYTAVDKAESDFEMAQKLNVEGPKNIARLAKKIGAVLIHISTDYVFDGEGEEPWKVDDKRNPLNVYGLSKCKGEEAVERWLEKYFIVRIAWVFGQNGHNFINTMLNLGKTHDKLTVVSDQIGTPTYTYDLARLLVDMIESDKYGIYHATNEGGYISWYDFTVEIMKQAGRFDKDYLDVSVEPVGSDAYPAKAKRPSNSRMDKSKLSINGFEPLPDWKDALKRYLDIKMK